jgi:cytochrome c-type biogenesis protein CcmH/NrfG
MTMLGHYYHDIGKRKLALEAFRIAVQTDPSHPSVATLEKKLFYQPFFRIIKFFLRKIFHRI